MWIVFDHSSGIALPGRHPKACFETARVLGWTNFTIQKGNKHA
ncbi:MAG: hypothetical protein VX181_03790 [Pseudomonadota bacterium]|jgi:hypothetical protein|nr:hypothetical protein [Thalassovita sp.]MEC8039820.1 hypothetical protein [Pseudomonadota bacterium]